MDINKKNVRMWSRMGARAFYGQAFTSIASVNTNVIGVSADLGRSSGLDRFSKEFPGQFVNVGIAEQNMIGVCAGLARCGFDVFATTFAPFASMRASEQVRMNMGYMGEPVKLVALGSGLAMGFLGNSHFGLEDLAVMRAIPGLTIISPADCTEIFKTISACIGYRQPVYIRLTGAINLPIVYEEDYNFEIGKAVYLREPQKVTVISSGTTVGHAKQAIEKLQLEGISVGLINMHTIKPLDTIALVECFERSHIVISLEEHFVTGGLGSAITDFAVRSGSLSNVKLICHGIYDEYVKTGDYPYMLNNTRLDSDGLFGFIKEAIELAARV